MALPEIGRFLAENSAQFLGFEIDAGVLIRFLERYPQENAMRDLERWHVFETEHPPTFAGMYQFWICKNNHTNGAKNDLLSPSP